MSYKSFALAAGLAVATLSSALAADLAPMPVKAKPIIDVPFFLVNDNRLTYAYQFDATSPGFADKTAKQVYAFTHFDVWAYGTNFINLELLKSDHRDPAHQGRFAGAIFAEQGVDLARSDIEIDRIIGEKIAVSLGDADRLKKRQIAGSSCGGRCV